MTYFNTTHQAGKELLDFRAAGKAQDEIVLDYFQRNAAFRTNLTASEVYDLLIDARLLSRKTPLTSIRRSMTCLMRNNRLVKTTTQRKGPFGRPEYCYALQRGQLELVI